MPEPSQFRHYQIIQDADGNNVELVRDGGQVAVLAFDMQRLEYVHCHVLLEPLANRSAFDEICRGLQSRGHPAMARLVDFGEDEGNPFYITSNVDGELLRAYLQRQQDLPGWLALLLASRAMEAAVAVCERGEFLTDTPLDSFRVVQTAAHTVQVLAADYRVVDHALKKKPAEKGNFDRLAKFLRNFLTEQGGGPTLPEQSLPAASFAELLGACLAACGGAVLPAMKELRASLQKLVPEHLTGEIPTPQKPRSLLTPLLAGYQDVARGMVNLVRIQSQRLDMTSPYCMRGTLTKTGRAVLIEQVPSAYVACASVREADEAALKASQQRDNSGLVTLALVNETDEIVCLAEEVVDGINLAELLRERRGLDIQEAYLVLAGLDAALTQVERANLAVGKLRLEDIFLLTGFPREDARSAKLLTSRLNEWPAFNLIVRAHPTLSSMAARGTDPAVLLPTPKGGLGTAHTPPPKLFQAGWLAALTKFLIGLEHPVGVAASGALRPADAVLRLLEDEIAKVAEAKPGLRADFLARFARVMQTQEAARPTTTVLPAAKTVAATTALPTQKEAQAGVTLRSSSASKAAAASSASAPAPAAKAATPAPKAKREFSPPLAAEMPPVAALTTGGASRVAKDDSHIGFAELLFKNAGGEPTPPDAPDWVTAAVNAPPTLPAHLIPKDDVPVWLKAAVFLGGSMVLGALLAHLSGGALWLKKRAEVLESLRKTSEVQTVTPQSATPPVLPKAVPIEPAVLKAIPVTAPPVEAPPSGSGVSLSTPKGTGLREQLSTDIPSGTPAPPAR